MNGPLVRPALMACLAFAASCGPSDPPTWAGEVAAVVHQNCAACHRPEGPGPMSLLTYEDALPHADLMAQMTSERRMPPWLVARDAGLGIRDARGLTEGEIGTLARWAAAGAPEGDAARAPEPPSWSGAWSLGTPDLVLSMTEAFTVPGAAEQDLFRNFVLEGPQQEARWVRAVELLPDNPGVVHHATIRLDPTRTSRLADLDDSLPGFDALVAESAARPPGGFFAGWTPGRMAAPLPEGTAWRLEPGTDFVVNAHLWPSGEPEEVTLRVGVYFSEEEPTRVPTLLRLGVQTINIPPGDSAYVVEDEFRIPVAVEAIGVYPHAHFLARTVSAWADTPDGGRVPLIEIPEWDFNRQEAYYYAAPVELPAGSTVRMRYQYDNSAANPANPSDPPERVLWGLNSDDEMAEFWLQVVPRTRADREELVAQAQRRDVEKQIEGWEHLAALDPDNPDVHAGLAGMAEARGDPAGALAHYEAALEGRPRMAAAHYGRARALETLGDVEGSVAAYRRALEIRPTNLGALTDLGRLLHETGDVAGARTTLERAVALDSAFADSRNNLAGVLLTEGRIEEAEVHLRRAVDLAPEFPEAWFNLAAALVSSGRTQEGIDALRRGVELDGEALQPVVSVAWMLATRADAGVRNPQVALDLALQVREITGPDPVVSDVAAAALASLGSFDRALELVDEAIAAASAQGASALLPALRDRRALYAQGEAYLERAPGPPVPAGGVP